MPLSIDVNADLGEGFGDSRARQDEGLLDLVSSANIACGFHAGDATTMLATVRAAKLRGVTIGAHPSYPDLPGFGRRELGLSPKEISRHVVYQIRALREVCGAEGAKLSYVKPHGALYNRGARDRDAAAAIVAAIRDVEASLTLLGPAGSEMDHAAARAGMAFATEAFVDRAYRPDGTLVPRDQPDAVIHDVKGAVQRAVMLVKGQTITADDGTELRITAQSLCVHGDNPDASAILRALNLRLKESGVTIAPYSFVHQPDEGIRRDDRAFRRLTPSSRTFPPHAQPLGDSAVAIVFGTERSAELLHHIHSAARALEAARIPNVEDVVPAYLALTVFYDSLRVSYREISAALLAACDRVADFGKGPTPRTHRIPVRYDGPDLDFVASSTGLSVDEVVARHSGRSYTVDLLGFVPGFGYLGELDPSLHLPRRAEPRPRVAAGSVAIAAAQTAVYPLDTPGGWHIIGLTQTAMFDPARDPPALLAPGDTVNFERVQ